MIQQPATSPQKKRKRWRALDLTRGLHLDMLDGLTNTVVDTASALERRIIEAVKHQSIQPNPNRNKLISILTNIVSYGVGILTGKGRKTLEEAEKLGVKTAQHKIGHMPQNKRLPAPKAPRNVDLGTTVRTPKALDDTFQQLAHTLIGSGSALFDEVVLAIVENPPESEAARRRIAQTVLDQLRDKGITGYVDKAGRRWNLVSYVEMATRKAAGDLAFAAHMEEMLKAGLDVVRVTVMPNCHPYCQPYQGRLLSLTGETTHVGGEKVVATVSEAVAHGFRHIGCRHTIYHWQQGDPFVEPDSIDHGDYEASQALRRLEREVRRWKRAEAGAVTDEAQSKARARIRLSQKKIREHVHKTGVVRNRYREQVAKAL
ncbi:putative phage minor capsid protein [Corynebacterium diphtheriae]|uniref:putative phage minor capsid protein n=1 Tax=Corynebacterium diphtheriae TaxID=1717 RepID=UPI0002467E3A|nr:putative phage minor capsid protein [Corynebacterium diphtheriae]AEX67273.1 putative phage minor capsid protein [Corynebacterium diphtheriae C7 (beta)]UEB35861.1 phage minor capsid protein [Corynebacterium diphtheriae subsp. diphtheriae]CAB1048521.1 putative phage minor capsid protein [Corynebacterium diphtheriae]CKG89115.1 putative phage minor capsid protein [Corynebacterium diphtheriae]